MKQLRWFLISGIILLIGALGALVFVWFTVLSVTRSISEPTVVNPEPARSDVPTPAAPAPISETGVAPVTATPAATTVAPAVPTGESTGRTFSLRQLTPEQREVLQAVGISGDTLTLSVAAESCIRETWGNERTEAVLQGEVPSILEVVRVVSCLEK
jgi:hypothetical protein